MSSVNAHPLSAREVHPVITAWFPSLSAARQGQAALERSAFPATFIIQPISVVSVAPPRSHRLELIIGIIFTTVLAMVVLIVPGVGYSLAALAFLVGILSHPTDLEHRLKVQDELATSGGHRLTITSSQPLDSLAYSRAIRILRNAGAIEIATES